MIEMISIHNLYVNFGNRSILKNIELNIYRGKFYGLIGPNGSGKTTLLKTIAKLLPYQQGSIEITEKKQKSFNQKELAKTLSYVPQDTNIDFDFQVKDIVAMGRHAHQHYLNRNQSNEEIIRKAMIETDTYRFYEHSILNLSGGQRQLVFIAKALAQDTPIILLDEPISALDIYYQLRILKLLQQLSKQGKTVVIVLHDLNLAARFCEKLILLKDGAVEVAGNCNAVLTQKTLKNTYQIDASVREDEIIDSLYITPL
ncbi:iron complex transport system ATP-binding protein [Gracilibacillus halotolerans]|uniref:Iron complex transport system ATP-binding protein n=2 Tax=Gracilibacillus halotolerans TaxID=74386 RepID=A0A841RMJ0_9BACI|nr:iron complex transport system ATP-binding protein [Gracilibacillus halotolerans]